MKVKRPQRHFLGAVAALVAFSAIAAAGGVRAAASVTPRPQTDENVVIRHAAWAGTTVEARDATLIRLMHKASDLVDFNKGLFAGTYISGDNLVLVTASEAGDQVAALAFPEEPRVSFERASMSLSRASNLGYELLTTDSGVRPKLYATSLDVQHGVIRVGADQELSAADASELDSFAQQHHIELEVDIDLTLNRGSLDDSRLSDDSPFSGAMRVASVNGSGQSATFDGFCTAGYGYQSGGTNYVLIAGHCFPKDTSYSLHVEHKWHAQHGLG